MLKSKSGNPKLIQDMKYNRDSVVASMFDKLSYDAGGVCHNGLLQPEFKSGMQVTTFTTMVANKSFSRSQDTHFKNVLYCCVLKYIF